MRVLMHWDCIYLCTHVPKSSSCLLNPTIYMCLFVFRMPHLIRFLYLFSVKSAFSWCVDEDLLEMNNLISPKDYLATQKPHVRAPAAGIWPSLTFILNLLVASDSVLQTFFSCQKSGILPNRPLPSPCMCPESLRMMVTQSFAAQKKRAL